MPIDSPAARAFLHACPDPDFTGERHLSSRSHASTKWDSSSTSYSSAQPGQVHSEWRNHRGVPWASERVLVAKPNSFGVPLIEVRHKAAPCQRLNSVASHGVEQRVKELLNCMLEVCTKKYKTE